MSIRKNGNGFEPIHLRVHGPLVAPGLKALSPSGVEVKLSSYPISKQLQSTVRDRPVEQDIGPPPFRRACR